MSTLQITPRPNDDVVAAILSAYEALWPQPAAAPAPTAIPLHWRFSGRWWAAPAVTRRQQQTRRR